MNRVLLEVTKAIEAEVLDDCTCALVLQFIVERRCAGESCKDEFVKCAEVIRRALVDASAPGDLYEVQSVLESMAAVKRQREGKEGR